MKDECLFKIWLEDTTIEIGQIGGEDAFLIQAVKHDFKPSVIEVDFCPCCGRKVNIEEE